MNNLTQAIASPPEVANAILQGAKETADPSRTIEDALARLPQDPGALFEPGVLDALHAVRAENAAEFARIRAKVKDSNAGILAEFDRLTQHDEGSSDAAIDRLIAVAKRHCILAHNADRQGVAIIQKDTHREVWLVRGSGFSEWLRAAYFDAYETGASGSNLEAAITTIEAIGLHRGDLVEVFLRSAKRGDAYFVDLCDAKWRVIKVDANGYELLDCSPVLFTRNEKMRPLPAPEAGGNLEALWGYANVAPGQRPLAVAFLLDAMRPDTPFPVLEIVGEQGSAKSTTQRFLRDLIDPNKVPLRCSPGTTEDIFVGAASNSMVSYENLSYLSNEEQDAICTLSTGGGYATRKFYTNGEEHVLETKRPVMLNSISGVCTRPDLIERTVRIDAPSIAPNDRREESELEQGWRVDHPKIFGALLTRFSQALATLPTVQLSSRQRMADFQRLGEAMMQAEGGAPGTFSELYANAVKEGTERALENYGVVGALTALMDSPEGKSGQWHGTVGVLFTRLVQESRGMDQSNWPRSAKGLSDQLKRLTPALRGQGIEVRFGARSRQGRPVTITRIVLPGGEGKAPIAPTDKPASALKSTAKAEAKSKPRKT